MDSQLIIAHRGNLDGPDPRHENMPEYVLEAIGQGFDVECDFWRVGEELFLGHNIPQYKVRSGFLLNPKLWVHCKNIEAMWYAGRSSFQNTFWHQTDDCVITTGGYLWTYPGKPLTDRSIAVLPELVPDWDTGIAYGVCTDYPMIYRRKAV